MAANGAGSNQPGFAGMKLTTKEDIEAPIGFVYAALTDFEAWERAAMRRGAEVNRTDKQAALAPGMGWKVEFLYRGKSRVLELQLAGLEPGEHLAFSGSGKPAEGTLTLDLAEMGPKRTRVTVVSEVKPRTLAARLFMQTLRLAKAKVTRRFEVRVAQVAADIEDRFRAQSKV